MKRAVRLMLASALLGASGLAAAAEDFSLSFKTASGSAFTQYFSVTADALDSLYLMVTGSSKQYDSLSFDLLANDSTIHVDATSSASGAFDASFEDVANDPYLLVTGKSYTLVVSGVTKTLANGVNGVVSIQGFEGAVAPAITAAVPEPETWAMLLAGLGFVGVLARRRARKA